MGGVRLPSEHEKRVIVDFLRDSTNVWVEGVHFERMTDGAMRMRCKYRDIRDATQYANLVDPSPKDMPRMDDKGNVETNHAFEDLAVAMSDWLEHSKLDWLTDPAEKTDGATVQ